MADQVEEWGVLELMGYVKIAGRISEQERFGTKLGRIDIPTNDGSFVTQFFGGGSVYRLTITDEQTARKVAAEMQPRPVQQLSFSREPEFDHMNGDLGDGYYGDDNSDIEL